MEMIINIGKYCFIQLISIEKDINDYKDYDNSLSIQKIITTMRNRQKCNSLTTTQSISCNKNKNENSQGRESRPKGHRRPVLFRNMAIKKIFITDDYTISFHQASTQHVEECQIKEGRQPKRHQIFNILNSFSSHIHDQPAKRIENQHKFSINITNTTIYGKYIGLSSYKHRKNLRKKEQSQLILKKLKFCSKQARQSSANNNQSNRGLSCKSIFPIYYSDRYNQKLKEPCCKKSLSLYIEPTSISSRVEKRQQQSKRQIKRVRCKTINSLRLDVG